jgi:hypothetical protein
MNASFSSKLQTINRPTLYVTLFVIVVIGLLFPIDLPVNVSGPTQQFYDAVEKAPVDKVAFVSTLWSASTKGENEAQTRVVLQHLMRRHIPFMLAGFGLDAQTTQLAQELAEEVTKEWNDKNPDFPYKYGENWINLGFRVDMAGTLKGAVVNLKSAYATDQVYRKPMDTYPMMKNIHNMQDVGIICEIAPSNGYKNWVGLVRGGTQAKLCYAVTSVMGPEMYDYLDARQIEGLLFGIRGAAEYEKLMGIKGFTFRAMTPISFAMIYLFLLIGLGNWGMYAAKRASAREAA